ncbi:MAG: histidine phosphatase family protein [Paludibacteraceae bacterium]|nr:histidine phosphatase family protein [Paludibacteraceae bacterium]
MTRFYLVRHGQTDWNQEKRMQGQHETDLTPLGKKQAIALGERLEDIEFDLVYSSPQRRAMETTRLILGKRQIPIIPDDALKEILMGDWQGILIEDLMEEYPEEIDLFWHHPEQYRREGCETYDDVRKRAGQFMERTAAENPGKNILVVTHGALLKTLYTYFKYQPIAEIAHAVHPLSTAIAIVEKRDGIWNVMSWNDTEHLAQLEEESDGANSANTI